MKYLQALWDSASSPPKFDFWFWMLLIWAFVVPYLFDQGHRNSCLERGRVSFYTIDSMVGLEETPTFSCTPVRGMETGHVESHNN